MGARPPRLVGPVAASAPLLALLAGCAGGPAPDASAPTPKTSAAEVVSVRLEVSGGLTGAREVHRFERDDPPPALTGQQVQRVLDLAGRVEDQGGRGVRPRPVPCCDRRVFSVTVEYDDGTRVRARTTASDPSAAPLDRLVRLLSEVEGG